MKTQLSLSDCTISSVLKYKEYRNLLNRLKCKCKVTFYKDKCIEFKNNSRKLWQLINTCIGKTNDKTNLINYIKVRNIDIYDSKQIADEIGNYFSSIGSTYAKKIPPSNKQITDYLKVIPRNAKTIFLSPTSKHEIETLLSKLPNKKSSGFDNIDNIILKSMKNVISEKLAFLFDQSMLQGIFPDQMKLAEVVPLYKSKERYLTNNY